MPLLRCRRLQAGGPVPLRALSHPIPELGGRDRTGPSLTQIGDPSRAALRLESLTPGSLLPSLRFGVTLSSLRVRYAPFGESPRVLPRSGSSLSQPLRESERLARDGDDDTVQKRKIRATEGLTCQTRASPLLPALQTGTVGCVNEGLRRSSAATINVRRRHKPGASTRPARAFGVAANAAGAGGCAGHAPLLPTLSSLTRQ